MKAVNWLNSRTPDSLSFFAVQIDLVQISGSLPAALFKVLAQPSEWTLDKGGGPAGTGVSTRRAAYHEYFIDLLARLKNASPGFTNTSRIGYDNWLGFSAGRTGFGYTVSFVSGDKFRVELYIDLGEQVTNKAVFDSLEQEAPQLESAMGEGLVWHRLDNRRASRICVERDGNIFSPDPLLDELKDWGVERLIRFREVFTSRLKTLVIPVLEAAEPQIESEELA